MDENLEQDLHLAQTKSNAWLLTFVDTLSILITFFILLYSTSINDSIHDEASHHNSNQHQQPQTITGYGNQQQELSSLNLSYIYSLLSTELKQSMPNAAIKLQLNEDCVIIAISAAELFTPGTAILNNQADATITLFAEFLQKLNNKIDINGIDSWIYFSGGYNHEVNFKLSLLRAVAVAKKIKALGYLYEIGTHGLVGIDYKLHDIQGDIKFLQRIDIIIQEYKA